MLTYSALDKFIDNAKIDIQDQCRYWLSLLDPFWQGYAKMLFDSLKATKIKNMGDVSYAELALKLASYMQENH